MKPPHIGLMNESSLHEALKHYYYKDGDEFETSVDGYVVDIKRGDSVVEIQTGRFGAIRKKLTDLLANHDVRLVHPVAVQTTLRVFDSKKKKLLYTRKSPKHGALINIVDQLIYIPQIVRHPRFSLEVLLTEEEDVRSDDGLGSWRRKGISKIDRRLVNVVNRTEFNEYRDYLMLLPPNLPSTFTNKTLAALLKVPRSTVQKLTYALKNIGLLRVCGFDKRSQVFEEV